MRRGPARDRDVTLLYLIKQVELAVRQALDDVVASADLTTLQYTALTVLERHPGITSAELARNSFVRAQTMAEMVTFLLGRGLVTRERDQTNRKQYLLTLTSEGQRVLDDLLMQSPTSRRRCSTGSTVARPRSCAPISCGAGTRWAASPRGSSGDPQNLLPGKVHPLGVLRP